MAFHLNTGPALQDKYLTYRQLDERANQLARFLEANGVQPEQPVGVMLERSLELMVAMMGVLKAGGAFVPMDPEYPADRLAIMAEDAEVRACTTVRGVLKAQDELSFRQHVLPRMLKLYSTSSDTRRTCFLLSTPHMRGALHVQRTSLCNTYADSARGKKSIPGQME